MAFHLKWRKWFKQEKRRGGEKSVDCEGKFLRGHVATTYLSPPETITTLLFGYMCKLSHFSHVWLFETLWTIAQQAPLFMGFSRQEYWSGLPFPYPGESSWPRDQTCLPHCVGFFITEPLRKPQDMEWGWTVFYSSITCVSFRLFRRKCVQRDII